MPNLHVRPPLLGWTGWLTPATVAAAAGVAALVPYLPAGPDLYVHLLWCWEVMRCLAAGALPLWLPDLNAGFGSPGIRLYSPLGPFLQGVAGLVLGSAGAALRAVPVLGWGGFLVAVRRRRGSGGAAGWGILLAAPIVAYSLLGRGAWSEFLAIPLLWWLLDAAEGTITVVGWKPLERKLRVETAGTGVVALRLLDYPYWQASVDGSAAAVRGGTGVVAVEVPAGRHLVTVGWAGDPWARVGLATAAATGLALG